MIEPSKEDVGRGVVYHPSHWAAAPREDGVITSFNDRYVFVRFGKELNGKATLREDLTWLNKRLFQG